MTQPLNFPARIYQILENESPDIIVWNSNGLSFRIVNHIRFEAEVIPKYFRHRKLSSVQRQLNVYGFRSISRGEHKRSFYHPLFKRGNWEVVKQMQRYVPTKPGQHMDLDPSGIESALPMEEATYEKPRSGSFFGAVHASPNPINYFPVVRGGANGKVQVNMSDDFSPDHFACDFQSTSDVGHEKNYITVQPVDYSIPIDFSVRNEPVDGNMACRMRTFEDSVMSTDDSACQECDWALGDDAGMWTDLILDPAAAGREGWATAPQRLRRTSSARLFSQLTPPLEGQEAEGAFVEQKMCLENAAPMQQGGWGGDAGNGCSGDVYDYQSQYQYAPLNDTNGGGEGNAWAAAAERYRSDSMNELYALCAELV